MYEIVVGILGILLIGSSFYFLPKILPIDSSKTITDEEFDLFKEE